MHRNRNFFVQITKNNVLINKRSKSQFPNICTCALLENKTQAECTPCAKYCNLECTLCNNISTCLELFIGKIWLLHPLIQILS